MSERRGTKALEVWCKRVTAGYPGVNVENMTTSWRDGLAFCAMIHHFRPDLIDFSSLDKHDVYHNNALAFRIAEQHLGIPALLDAEDMVEYEVPDRLCMLTYLSQFYQFFVGQPGNLPNSRTPVKRSSVSPSLSSSPDLSPSMSPASSSPPTKVQARGAGAVRDPCTHCGLPVFLAERLIVGNKRALYHRTCFRCARCSAQLSLANCYETEDGRFCCETCPDEENDRSDSSSFVSDRLDNTDNKCESVCSFDEPKPALHHSSHSDDEKSSGINTDELSAAFERALDNPTSQHLGSASLASTQHVTHDLDSKSEDSSLTILHSSLVNSSSHEHDVSQLCAQSSQKDKLLLSQVTKESTVSVTKDIPLHQNEESLGEIDVEPCQSRSNDNSVHDPRIENVHSNVSSVSKHQHMAVSTGSEMGADNLTKESHFSSADKSSIVKLRKLMFEADSSGASSGKVFNPKKFAGSVDKSNLFNKMKEKNSDSAPINSNVGLPSNFKTSSCFSELSVKLTEPSISLESKCRQANDKTRDKEEKEEETEKNAVTKSKENDAAQILKEFHDEVSRSDELDESEVRATVPAVRPSISPRKVFLSPHSQKGQSEQCTVSPQSHPSHYPSELNPFGEEEEEDSEIPAQKDSRSSKEDAQNRLATEKLSTNPFGSSDEEDTEPVELRKNQGRRPPRPPPPQSSSTISSKTAETKDEQTSSMNPFCSDGEEPSGNETKAPVPRPRTVWLTPEPSPRSTTRKSSVPWHPASSSGQFGSTSSLTSVNSGTSTNQRSKKPAPAPPPTSFKLESDSVPHSPFSSLNRSPHRRKSRPAPPPPSSSSVEIGQSILSDVPWDKQKVQKNEANWSKQADDKDETSKPRDKSTYGQWKRKKGPAPPRPVPQRRQVQAMPSKELKRELDDIEVKQQELERQGVKLEQTIRLKFEETPELLESSMTHDVEVLVLQLFELVNEKNELFRKQAELMYLRRQHRLEEEHAELEFQIRCLMEQPERNKTDSDKAKEEELIQRLVEVVERRNEIIECLDMDRLREAEEDSSIHAKLGLYAAKEMSESVIPRSGKSKKDKKKKKESKKKKDLKLDADKDIDEIEAAAIAAAKEKKSKRRWF